MLAANGSIFTILAISFERYYAICKPLKAGYKCTRWRATIIICVIWLLACILTSPILIMAKSSETIYIDGSLVHNCILETDTYWPKMYVFVSMFAFFCLPLLVLMLVYWLISRRLIRENVAMMDIKRDHHHSDSRFNSGHTTGTTNSSSINGIHVSSIFKKQSNTKSSRPLLSFLKSNQHHEDYGHEEYLTPEQRLFRQRNQRVSLDHEKITSVLLAQTNSSQRIEALPEKSPNNLQRIKLKGGKALSLDCQASGKRHATTTAAAAVIDGDDDDQIFVPKEELESLSRTRSDSQSCWSASTMPNSRGLNYQSSIVDATTATTTTTTTSMSNSVGETRTQSHRSFLSRLFLANSRFVRHLLNLVNLSSLLPEADRVDDKIPTGHETNLADANDMGIKLDYNANLNDHDHDRTPPATGMKMSSTSCDNKLINNQESSDVGGEGELAGQKSFDIAHMHSRLMNAISKPNCATITRGISELRTGGGRKCDGHSPRNHHGIVAVTSAKSDRGGSTRPRHTATRGASLFSHSKRPLDNNNNKRITDNRSSLHTKSRFKWVKGVSVSSSTGSTYTNSTCLLSETGSATPSLQLSNRQQNSPSPPRPIITQQHKIATSRGTSEAADNETGPLVCSRDNSPDNMNDRKRIAHFDGIHEGHRDRFTANPSYGRRTSQTRAQIVSNSRSSSITYHEAENICYSDDCSSSPSLSIAADSSERPSWLESLVFQEQQNYLDQSQPRASKQRKLSQHEEEKSAESEPNSDSGALKTTANELNRSCHESYRDCQGLEIVMDEDEPIETSASVTNEQINGIEHLGGTQKDLVGGELNKRPPVKAKVRRSLTDDRASSNEMGERKLISIDLTTKRFSRDSALPSPIIQESCRHSIVSTNSRLMSKMNLVAMAHSLADNLHHKRTGRRSGSHPVVSNRAQLVASEHNGLQTEFMAVRDISKKQQMDSRRQVVAMLAFVVACFFLLFFPYRVFTIWLILSTEDQVQSLGMETYYNLTYFSRILIYLHSAINPIAYNLISTKFRRAFMSILLCRGAATRRNFNIDHRYLHESKNHVNNHNRPGVANKSLRTIRLTNAPS